jgi:GNAT superfamily N-acetyltransferase
MTIAAAVRAGWPCGFITTTIMPASLMLGTAWSIRDLYVAPQCRRSGIARTLLQHAVGLEVPIVVLPFVNTALAGRAPFRHGVESLRAEGVRILLGPGGFQPHPPRTGGNLIDSYPWHLGIDEAERMLDPAPP